MTTDVTSIKVDVEVLKSQLTTLTNLCEKMDKVIEKIVDHQGVIINQIYDDMDKREDDTNADIKDINERITSTTKELSEKVNETERRIMDELKILRKQIDDHNKKEDSEIQKILKWKWTIAGGVIVISWIISHIDILAKILL